VTGLPFNAAEWLVDRHVAAGGGSRVAYRYGDETLTYSQLEAETWRAVAMLGALGVAERDRVLMLVLDEPAFPAVFLGALRIGAVPIPVSTMLRPEEVALVAADSGVRAAVVSTPFVSFLDVVAAAAPDLNAAVVIDSGLASGAAAAAEPDVVGLRLSRWSEFSAGEPSPTVAATTADSEGFWLYTSGTTGRPKGAVHRHGDIKAVADTYSQSVLSIGPDDVCYSVAKLFFAFGLGNALFFPLSVAASAVLDPAPPTPAKAAEFAARHRPTLFFAPPGFCAAMAGDPGIEPSALSSIRATVTAGETLPAEVYRRFRGKFDVEMLDGIGSTEALHIFCSNHLGDVRPGSTGRVVEGYELRILDENGIEIDEPDTPGALWVRGESVTKGYWQRPEVNAETFVDGWCRTGDVYRRDAEGYYYFVGRNSDMIKAGGIWVSPAEVEAALLEHPTVLEAAVVGGVDDDGLEMTVAFVVPAVGQTVDEQALLMHCRQRMAAFKRPRQLHVVDELPKTATGKIKRFALRASLVPGGALGGAGGAAGGTEPVPPPR
jgi:benzoate-CoA ligase family protein